MVNTSVFPVRSAAKTLESTWDSIGSFLDPSVKHWGDRWFVPKSVIPESEGFRVMADAIPGSTNGLSQVFCAEIDQAYVGAGAVTAPAFFNFAFAAIINFLIVATIASILSFLFALSLS